MRTALALALLLGAAAPAHGIGLAPYDGAIQFDCVLQQAGTGTIVPDPRADPLCVEYDKTRQNLTRAEIVAFLLGEPARVTLAAPACWYHQHDHWHGSIDQDSEWTETYNWDGNYFWDKARGVFGLHVRNFTVNNQSVNPSGWPGFPQDWRPYFGYGRGGIRLIDSIPVDPACVEKARRRDPYAKPPAAPPPADLRVTLRHRGRRCVRASALVRLAGADVERVYHADFRVRGRRLAREERAPFGLRLRRRHLRRAVIVRVAVLLRGGERRRLAVRVPRRCARSGRP